MTSAPRDRDPGGRPRSARPRDGLGRPLPYGSPDAAADLDPALLEGSPETLLARAQRLLDAGRPFQAHEVLEAGWKSAPERERPLWRALAQLAVGVTHARRGNTPGATTLFARAAGELEVWDARSAPHGIDVVGLAQTAHDYAKAQQPQAIRLTRERG